MWRAGYRTNDNINVYTAIVRSVLEYACVLWHPSRTKAQSEYIEHIKKRSLDIAFPSCHYMDALGKAGLESLGQRRESLCESFFNEIQHAEHKLHYLLPEIHEVQSNHRTIRLREPFKSKMKHFQNSPINYGLHKFH